MLANRADLPPGTRAAPESDAVSARLAGLEEGRQLVMAATPGGGSPRTTADASNKDPAQM